MNPAQTSNSFRAERQFKTNARTSIGKMLVRSSAFFILVGLVGTLVYSSSHASSPRTKRLQPQAPSTFNQGLTRDSVSPRIEDNLLERMGNRIVPGYLGTGFSM